MCCSDQIEERLIQNLAEETTINLFPFGDSPITGQIRVKPIRVAIMRCMSCGANWRETHFQRLDPPPDPTPMVLGQLRGFWDG